MISCGLVCYTKDYEKTNCFVFNWYSLQKAKVERVENKLTLSDFYITKKPDTSVPGLIMIFVFLFPFPGRLKFRTLFPPGPFGIKSKLTTHPE